MSQQPEALKHAEWLERSLTIGAPEAAAELRRLHARDRAWWAANTEMEAEIATLRAQVERLQAAGQVGNPLAKRCYTMSESHLSGYRVIVGFECLGDSQDAHSFIANIPKVATNAELDSDSNASSVGQQRDMAGPLEVGQHVGCGPDQIPGIIARVDAWRSSGESEWAHGVNSGIDAAVQILKSCGQGTPAQEGADTGADERMAFERAARCCAFIKDLQRFPDDYWDNARAGKYGHYETEKARTIWLAALSYAALAARSGQVAASAMVELSEAQLTACLLQSSCIGTVKMSFESGPYEIDRPSINADRLCRAIESASAKLNGLTVGGSKAGGEHGGN